MENAVCLGQGVGILPATVATAIRGIIICATTDPNPNRIKSVVMTVHERGGFGLRTFGGSVWSGNIC
jgi:outer membrane lipoprotein SlyB